jgi:putative ABC transport system ATP-binding protein
LLNSAPIVEARDLTKSYAMGSASVAALRGVSLSVAAGEMVAIMGPSGCGKSTLLNCLAGLDGPDAGEVRLAGVPLASMSDDRKSEFRARHTGFIFQSYNLLPVLTAAENVEMPLLLAGATGREARKRALVALERVGLADRSTHRPAQLSGGQQQRVAVARALVNDPVVVWADEPTGNLDSRSAGDILDLLVELNRDGEHTFVIVTHAPDVARLCHRVIHMSDGRIVREVTNRHGMGSHVDSAAG